MNSTRSPSRETDACPEDFAEATPRLSGGHSHLLGKMRERNSLVIRNLVVEDGDEVLGLRVVRRVAHAGILANSGWLSIPLSKEIALAGTPR